MFTAAMSLEQAQITNFTVNNAGNAPADFYFAPTYNTATSTYTYGTNYLSNTKTGGGIFGSARVTTSKYLDLAVQAMAGQGVGRYGSAQLADATLRPDSTLEPLRNYHGMFSVESHPTPKLDIFAYYGGEYAQRTVYANANGCLLYTSRCV